MKFTSDADRCIQLSEVFVSLQGEGPSAGQQAAFVRTATCNLACRWCDTRYSWDWQAYPKQHHVRRIGIGRLAEDISALLNPESGDQINLLIITGGEPLLQQRALAEVLTAIRRDNPGVRCEVETNGTVVMTPAFARHVHLPVVSPKLASAGDRENLRIKGDALRSFVDHPSAIFKFVVQGVQDIHEIQELVDRYSIAAQRVWLMPQAESASALMDVSPLIADLALKTGFNFTTRLHVLLWDNTRGR
jgi:organic radical activating enzyme